jgi:hypothetical protein
MNATHVEEDVEEVGSSVPSVNPHAVIINDACMHDG